MRGALVLFLLLAGLGPVQAEEADLADQLRRVREASAEALPAALGQAGQALAAMASVPEDQQETCVSLLAEARTATEAKNKTLEAAGWKLAIPLLGVVKPLRASDAAWFLEHVQDAWAARGSNDGAQTAVAAAAIALYDGTPESAKLGRAADRSIKKALRAKGRPVLFRALALGLARAPQERARALLASALPWKAPPKGLGEADLVAILEVLGEAGGPGAAPILLAHVLGTGAAVLESALVGLSRLDVEALRKHGKKILAVTMKDNEDHHREMLALSNKSKLSRKEKARMALYEARAPAWMTERIVDEPPMKVPAGVGLRGVVALWWRVIDALGSRIKQPTPPKNARPQFLNGRPNIQGLNWYLWWRSAR